MWKSIKAFFSEHGEIDSLLNQAWKAQNQNRLVTVERLLVEATLLRLRSDFYKAQTNTLEQLSQQTPDGIYEIESLSFSRAIIGKLIDRYGFYDHDKTRKCHTSSIQRPQEIHQNKVATEITLSANNINLNTRYTYFSGSSSGTILLYDSMDVVKHGVGGLSSIKLVLTRNF